MIQLVLNELLTRMDQFNPPSLIECDDPRVQITRYYCSIQVNVCAQRNGGSNEMFITRANYFNKFSHPGQTFSTHFDTICDWLHVKKKIKQHNG